jgi:flagellar hook-associated protein 2
LNDVIPGMTLTLEEETSEPVTITVSSDPDAVEAKIQAFLDAYNSVISFIDVQSVYNEEAELKGPFVGESSVRRVMEGLSNVVTSEFTGLGQDYDALSLIGITTDYSSGALELDSDTFQDLLDAEPDQVADLFTNENGFIPAMLDRLDLYVDPVDGSLYERSDSIETSIEDLEDQVARIEERIVRYEERLRRSFSSMESTLGQLQTTQSYLSAMLGEDSS